MVFPTCFQQSILKIIIPSSSPLDPDSLKPVFKSMRRSKPVVYVYLFFGIISHSLECVLLINGTCHGKVKFLDVYIAI